MNQAICETDQHTSIKMLSAINGIESFKPSLHDLFWTLVFFFKTQLLVYVWIYLCIHPCCNSVCFSKAKFHYFKSYSVFDKKFWVQIKHSFFSWTILSCTIYTRTGNDAPTYCSILGPAEHDISTLESPKLATNSEIFLVVSISDWCNTIAPKWSTFSFKFRGYNQKSKMSFTFCDYFKAWFR